MTLRATTFLCLAILTLPAAARAAASSQDPDWPCSQRLVPRIVAAQVWAGPEPDAAAWNDDREIARLGARLAARRTPNEETEKLVEAFDEAEPKEALNAKLPARSEERRAGKGGVRTGRYWGAPDKYKKKKKTKETRK